MEKLLREKGRHRDERETETERERENLLASDSKCILALGSHELSQSIKVFPICLRLLTVLGGFSSQN